MQSLLLFALAQVQIKPISTYLSYEDGLYTVQGEDLSVSQIVDKIVSTQRKVNFFFGEEIPSEAKVRLNLKRKTMVEVLDSLKVVTPLRYTALHRNVTFCWSAGKVAKNKVRYYREGGSAYFAVSEAPRSTVYQTLENVTGVPVDETLRIWDTHPVLGKSVIKGVDAEVSFEPSATNLLKAIGDDVEPPKAKSPATGGDDSLQWTMTNIKSKGASFDADSKISFEDGQTSFDLNQLATALNAIFTYDGKDIDNKNVRLAAVQVVGNTFYIRGPKRNEIRRLLATQIDIAQSQVQLTFDTYVISGNAKSSSANTLATAKLSAGQEIASAYRQAILLAIQNLIANNICQIREEVTSRGNEVHLDIHKLFEACHLEITDQRRLGIAEIYLNLAYCPNDVLQRELPIELELAFSLVHESIERMVKPQSNKIVSPAENAVRTALVDLNNRIYNQAKYKASGTNVVASIGRNDATEDKQTRSAIEEFLLLTRFQSGTEAAAMLNKTSDNWDSRWVHLFESSTNETSQQIVRAGLRMDEILGEASKAVDQDANFFVDLPFKSWIAKEVPISGKANEGVRTLGSAELTLSSRSPGLLSAEATSFFPFQPKADISLDDVLPLLKRKDPPALPEDPDKKPTPPSTFAEKAVSVGLTSPEVFGLQQLFAQQQKSPFYRSVSPGMNIAVLPTMSPGASGAKLLVRLQLSVDASDNKPGPGSKDMPAPINLVKSVRIEREIIVNSLDTTKISSLQLSVSAPGKRDWEFPILSQNWPLQSWFVGPTMDKTINHEAIVLMRVNIKPKAMDLAYRFL